MMLAISKVVRCEQRYGYNRGDPFWLCWLDCGHLVQSKHYLGSDTRVICHECGRRSRDENLA